MGILEWLQSVWENFVQMIQALVATLMDMLKDLFIFLFSLVMELGIAILNGIGSAMSWNPSTYISALPPEVTNIIGLIGVGEAITIIGGAILIRLTLQLVPFTRLGS